MAQPGLWPPTNNHKLLAFRWLWLVFISVVVTRNISGAKLCRHYAYWVAIIRYVFTSVLKIRNWHQNFKWNLTRCVCGGIFTVTLNWIHCIADLVSIKNIWITCLAKCLASVRLEHCPSQWPVSTVSHVHMPQHTPPVRNLRFKMYVCLHYTNLGHTLDTKHF